MKALYEKNELSFALVWIAIYCGLQSLANPLNVAIGIQYSASAALCLLQAIVLFAFVKRHRLLEKYGLCRSPIPARRFLYYIPLLILMSHNLWNGIAVNYPPLNLACHILCMLCVGFVEELIFRGFLFKALVRDNAKTAVVISSVSFGLGHLLNLVNGSGAELSENLFQVTGAIAIGFLFVILFHRGGSLLPCIIAHAAINISSAFANEAALTSERRIAFHLALILLTTASAALLTKTLPKEGASIGKG